MKYKPQEAQEGRPFQSTSSTFHSHFSRNNKIAFRNSLENMDHRTIDKYSNQKIKKNQFSTLQYLKVKPQPLRNACQKHTFKYFKSIVRQCHKHENKYYNYSQEGLIIHNYINWIQKNIKKEIFRNWAKLQTIFYLIKKQKNEALLKKQKNNSQFPEKDYIKKDEKLKIKNGGKISLNFFQINKNQSNNKKKQIQQITQKDNKVLQQIMSKKQIKQIFEIFQFQERLSSFFVPKLKVEQYNLLKQQKQNEKNLNSNTNNFRFSNCSEWVSNPPQIQNLTLQKISNRISYMHPFLVQFSRQIIIKKQNLLLEQILSNQQIFLDNSTENNKDLNYEQKRELVKRIIEKRLESYQFLNKNYQKLGKNAEKYRDVYKKSLTKFYKPDIDLNQNQQSQTKNQDIQIQNLLNDLQSISKSVQSKKIKQFQNIAVAKKEPKINIKGNKIKHHRRVVSQGQVKQSQIQRQNVPITNYEAKIKKKEDIIRKRKPFYLKAETRQSNFQIESPILQKSFSVKKQRDTSNSNFRNTVKTLKDYNQSNLNSKKSIKRQQKFQKSQTFHKSQLKPKLKKTKLIQNKDSNKDASQQDQRGQLFLAQNKQKQIQKQSQRQSFKENNRISIKSKDFQKQEKNQKFQIKVNRKRYQSMSNKNKVYWFKKKQRPNFIQKQLDQIIEINQPKNINKNQSNSTQDKNKKDLKTKPKIQIKIKNKKSKKKSADPFINLNSQQKNSEDSYPIMIKKESNKIRRIRFLNLNFLPKKIIEMILRQFDDVKQQKNIIHLKQKLLNYFNKLLEAGCFQGRLSQYRTQVEQAIRQYQRSRRTQSQLKSFCFVKSKKDQKMSQQKFTIKTSEQNIYDCLRSFHNSENVHKISTFQKLNDPIENELCNISLFNLQCKRFSGFNIDLDADFIQNSSDQQQRLELATHQKKSFLKQNDLIQFLKAYIKGQSTLLKQKQY